MVNECHTENVPFYTQRDPTLCKKRVCELEEKQWRTDRNESGTTFGQQRQGCNKCDESRAEGDPYVTSLPGEVSDLGRTCPQQGDLTIEEREDLMALLIAVRNELHDRGEDALIELVYQLMDRLLDDDTSEIADDARATIPRLHHLWCGTARRFDLTIDDSDEEGDSDEGDGFAALVHGTPERYATGCTSGPRRRPSSRREGLRPVCRADGAL